MACLVHQHVGERGRIVAAVAGHHHAAVAALMADAVGALRGGLHAPDLEGGVVVFPEKCHDEAFALPERLTLGDPVEVAEGVVHRVEIGDERRQLRRRNVAGHEELVGLGEDEPGKAAANLFDEGFEGLDLGCVFPRGEPRPGSNALRPHPGGRLVGFPFVRLLRLPAAELRPGLARGVGLVHRLAAGDDLGDAGDRHHHHRLLAFGPQPEGRHASFFLDNTLERGPDEPPPRAEFDEVDRLALVGREFLGQHVGPPGRRRDRRCQHGHQHERSRPPPNDHGPHVESPRMASRCRRSELEMSRRNSRCETK